MHPPLYTRNPDCPKPSAFMRTLGLSPDPWQLDALDAPHPRLLLNCCRQAGKSTTVAVLALYEAVAAPGALILLVSPSLRQSTELFKKITHFHRLLGSRFLERRTAHELTLTLQSRIVSLPCSEHTIRGFSAVHLLVIDEAARVPDDLYRAVRPMLSVSHGRLVALSTPHGKRGFFHDAWAKGGGDWKRIEVPASQIPRLSPETLAEEQRNLGPSWYRQEYECSFEALEGLVYPDFARCVVPFKVVQGRPVGGIDFGFRNPFAALWGVLDRDGVLWLTHEHYQRERPLSHHLPHLPKGVTWYADPSGAGERAEMRLAGYTVRKGNNNLRTGIAAVRARLESGLLKVLEGQCPNLLSEAALYRYEESGESRRPETPAGEHDHALDALRYLVSRLDPPRRLSTSPPPAPPPNKRDPGFSLHNEALWTRLW